MYWPNRWLTCFPLASKRATVSILVPVPFAPPNCVWLNVLYVSKRNCIERAPSCHLKFFMSERSQLLIPGPRKASFGEFPRPNFDASGTRITAVLKVCRGVRWSFESIALAVISGRTPDVAEVPVASTPRPPPPVMSVVDTREYVNPIGSPLRKDVTPEICQLSRIARLKTLFQPRLSFGVK